MTTMQWWRSWHGAPIDGKWSVIAARSGVKAGIVSALAWALFDHASQNDPRGSITGFDTEVYAVFSGFPENEIIAVIKAMKDKGIITGETLTAWKKRQPDREDYSTPRVTKHREMKRNVTQCNTEEEKETTDSVSVSVSESSSVSESLINIKDENFSKICALYENEIGSLSGLVSEKLQSALEEYPLDWIEKAIKIAVDQEKRRWEYVVGILKRWKVEGVHATTAGKKSYQPAAPEWNPL